MNNRDLKHMSEAALITQFRSHALEQEAALLDSDTAKYNRLYKKIQAIDSELRARGSEARKALLVLLDDPNLRVRFEAARRCLAVDRERAIEALNGIVASHQMPEEGWAGMTLQLLSDGIFKPT
jgi:hypothetical protein